MFHLQAGRARERPNEAKNVPLAGPRFPPKRLNFPTANFPTLTISITTPVPQGINLIIKRENKNRKKGNKGREERKGKKSIGFAFRQRPTVQKYYETIVTRGKWEGCCRRVGDSGDGRE